MKEMRRMTERLLALHGDFSDPSPPVLLLKYPPRTPPLQQNLASGDHTASRGYPRSRFTSRRRRSWRTTCHRCPSMAVSGRKGAHGLRSMAF